MQKEETPYGDLGSLDPSKRAAKNLDEAISSAEADESIVVYDKKIASKQERSKKERDQKKKVLVDVDEALHEEKIVSESETRQTLRILILTGDASMLKEGTTSQERLLKYSKMFAEVHVVVLCLKGDSVNEPDRVANNVWVYPTNSRERWKTGIDAYRVVKDQLVFMESFRVDVVISENPFIPGAVGRYFAKKYKRSFQVHLFEEYDSQGGFASLIEKYVMSGADCVRTKNSLLERKVVKSYPALSGNTETFPTYYDLDAWQNTEPAFDLHEEYPQFKFILVHFSSMAEGSHTEEVVDGLFYILKQYRTVGLIIVGNGKNREALQKRAVAFGIGNQIALKPRSDDIVSYIKTADVLIHTSENTDEDDTILCAGVVGTPIVAGEGGIAGELFEDGKEALLCPNDSPPCIGEKVNRLLNENTLRTQFERYARQAILERVKQDSEAHLSAYRGSIERCVALEG